MSEKQYYIPRAKENSSHSGKIWSKDNTVEEVPISDEFEHPVRISCLCMYYLTLTCKAFLLLGSVWW